jgi:hypothetical protein
MGNDDICVWDYHHLVGVVVNISIQLDCQPCHSLQYMCAFILWGDWLGSHVVVYWKGLCSGDDVMKGNSCD